jgi:hypothetical protein
MLPAQSSEATVAHRGHAANNKIAAFLYNLLQRKKIAANINQVAANKK